MSIPGSGLLAALRGKSKLSQDAQVTNESKFAARSSAVLALEQAVAAGTPELATKKRATGCTIDSLSFTYELELSHPKSIQPELTYAPITRVPTDYNEAHFRQIAVNDEFIAYGLKQGNIRVLHRFSEGRALLRGHTMPIADICYVGHNIIAAGGQDGQLYAWRITFVDDDNSINVEQILHAKFAPGCDSSPVMLAPGNECLAIAVCNAVMVLDLFLDDSVLSDSEANPFSNSIEIDPLDPIPARKMPNFQAQDTPTAVATSSDGRYLAAGSSHGRVYVCKLGPGRDIQGTAIIDADHGRAVSAVQWLHASETESTLSVSSRNGARHALFNSSSNGTSFTIGSTVMLSFAAESGLFVHTRAIPEQHLVILADTPREAVYVLHYTDKARLSSSTSGQFPVFDYLTRFKVGKSILNFASMWNPDTEDDGAIELYCVQTEGINQYFLDPDLCSPAVAEETAAAYSVVSSASPPPLPTMASTAASATSTDVAGGGGDDDDDAEHAANAVSILTATSLPQSVAMSTEGCPSPPSSPAAPRVTVQVPVPVAIQEADQEDDDESLSAKERRSAPKESTMTLLTPTDILRSTAQEKPTAASKQQIAAGAAAATAAVNAPRSADSIRTTTKTTATLPSGSTHPDLLQAIRTEFAAQRIATESLVKEVIAAERAAMLSREKASMDKLMKTIPSRIQDAIKTEFAALSTTLGAALTPAVQSAVHTALPSETSAAIKSALEKQLSASLQAALTKPIQDAFKHSFSKQIVPSFENACQSMFLQIDKTFTKGFNEHLNASKSAMTEPFALAASLRDALASVSTLSSADSSVLGRTASSGVILSPKTVDTKTEIKSLVDGGRFEEAFSKALGAQDVATVSWLCAQCDAAALMTSSPPALSQMVLLSLIQQLAVDLSHGTSTKLSWIREAAMALNPRDPLLGPHLKPVLSQVHKSLQGIAGRLKGSEAQSCRLAIHVINSQLAS